MGANDTTLGTRAKAEVSSKIVDTTHVYYNMVLYKVILICEYTLIKGVLTLA